MNHSEVFQGMRNDHGRVLVRLAILESAVKDLTRGVGPEWPGSEVHEVLAMLARQFQTHMAAEDEVLYPALAEALPQARPSLEPLRADHRTLRMMLSDLEESLRAPAHEARNEQIGVQLRDLVDLLRIHIRKEEAIVFALAERALTQKEVQSLAALMDRGASGQTRQNSRTAKGAST